MEISKANLMIVEDEAIVAEEIKITLEGIGYFVTSIVKTGKSAIEKAEQDRPDVILMDIRLEGQIDGIEAAERIRSRFGIPVIFLTAYADEEKLDRAKLTLPFGYLIKPIQTRDLKVTIEMTLYTAKIDAKRKQAEEALQKAHDELERRVEERTAELVKSNEQLIQEIEERKRTEEQLRLLSSVVEQSSEGMAVVDLEGNLLFSNHAFAASHGYTPEDLVDKHLSIFHNSEQMAAVDAATRQLQEVGEFSGEIWHIRRDGTVFPTLMHNTLLRDEIGDPMGMIGTVRDITDAKRAEEMLRQSEERFSAFFTEAPAGFAILDDQFRYVKVSETMAQINGLPVEEHIGKSVEEILQDLAHDVVPVLKRIIATGEPIVNAELSGKLPAESGIMRHWIYSAFPISLGNRQKGIGSVAVEITQQKLAEEKTKESNKLLDALNRIQSQYISESTPRVLFDQLLNNLISLTESEYGFIGEVLYTDEGKAYLKTHAITDIAWNKETREFYEKNAAAGMEFYNLKTLFGVVMSTGKLVIANDPSTDSRRGGLPEGHPPLNAFLGLPCYCGEELVGMVGVSNRPTGYDEELIGYLDPFLNTCGNIIDSYRNVQLRLDSEEKLRESETRYQGLFEDSRDAIVLVTKEGRIIDINQAGLDLFGYTREEMMRIDALELYIYPDDRRRLQHDIDRKGYVRDYELTLRKKDRTEMDCLVTVTAKRADDGSIIGYQSIIRDITEYKELEKRLQQAQRMEAIGTLAGGIAHDFNNILGAIIGYGELIQMFDIPKDSPLQKNLDQILISADRAKELVDRILTFSRQSEPEKKPVLLGPIVKEALKLLRASMPSTIEIRQHIEDIHDPIDADGTQLHQVIMNLCTNAGHAMRETGGILEVGLSAVYLDEKEMKLLPDLELGSYIRLIVSDTGCGIQRDIMERIFEPYFTTKKQGEGTGLGLSMVHGIVKNHGGAITVDSEPGKGTRFYLFFPVTERKPVKRVERPSEPILTGKGRILFVDDEKTLVDYAKKLLEHLGYDVVDATNSIEALELFRQGAEGIDLVITDQTMSGMTGLELTEAIKEVRSDVPVILCTGYSERLTPESAATVGVCECLNKPVGARKLSEVVHRILGEKSSGNQD